MGPELITVALPPFGPFWVYHLVTDAHVCDQLAQVVMWKWNGRESKLQARSCKSSTIITVTTQWLCYLNMQNYVSLLLGNCSFVTCIQKCTLHTNAETSNCAVHLNWSVWIDAEWLTCQAVDIDMSEWQCEIMCTVSCDFETSLWPLLYFRYQSQGTNDRKLNQVCCRDVVSVLNVSVSWRWSRDVFWDVSISSQSWRLNVSVSGI